MSKGRRRFYIVLAILVPFAAVFGLEGLLRVFGIGGHPSVIKVLGEFRDAHLATTYIPGSASYFDLSKSTPGTMGEYAFTVPKPPDTVRIVLSGASAIQGYPQPMGLANSAFLHAMLSDVWPDRNVEVINLGTTAVATFPVLDMMTQMLAYEPDLVVVYAGHNEFFGTYGVGSSQTGGNSPTAIRFNRWRSGLGIVQGWGRLTASRAKPNDKALMERMVGKSAIAPDSPLRKAAARNAGHHIGQMVERCQAASVPIMVCTLASNEKDLAPIGTTDLTHLDTATQSRLNTLIQSASTAADSASAVTSLSEALKIEPKHARVQYMMGKALMGSGDHVGAAQHFQKAIDFDPMPWRAPSMTNAAIVEVAKSSNAPLCDVRAAFRAASADGIIGWKLMDDHVHFSLQGQALLARTIVEKLTEFKGDVAVDVSAFEELPDWEQYAKQLGANEYEQYAVAHGLRNVFGVPFMKSSNPDAYARWDEACKRLFNRWPTEIRQVAQEWQDPKHHHMVRRPLCGFVARSLIRQKRHIKARPLMEAAARCVPLYSTWNIEYTYSRLLCDEQLRGELDEDGRRLAKDTIERIHFMLDHGGNAGLIRRYCARLHQLCGEWPESIPLLEQARLELWKIEKVACDAALIEACVRTGDSVRAREVAQEGIKHAGEFAPHYQKFLSAIPPG